jgi:hypothetical protein
MQQKYTVLSFAIVAALYIFLVPSTTHADYAVIHTPGETAGPGAAPAIKCGPNGVVCTVQGCIDAYIAKKSTTWWIKETCRSTHPMGRNSRRAELACNPRKGISQKMRDKHSDTVNTEFGTYIRYVQHTGGYCYYYQAGNSSGRGGPNTYRLD